RITIALRVARAKAQRDPSATVARITKAAENGDVWESVFATKYAVDDEHTQRSIGDMTKADLTFVANSFQARAMQAKRAAGFYRAVANKVGRKRVRDVMTEAEFLELRARIVGDEAA